MTSIALADDTVADGDIAVPLENSTLALGDVCASTAETGDALVAVKRSGSAASGTVFANSATVTFSAVSPSAGLSVAFPAGDTVTLPSDWVTSPSGTTFSASKTARATLNTAALGAYSGSVTIRASGLNTNNVTINRDQSLPVTANVINCTPSDTTPPVISYVLTPTTPDGDSGWYKSNVSLTWTVTENESPSSLIKTGCVDQNIVADQTETTYSCSATSDGGSAAQVNVTIKRDATNPLVSVTGFADGAKVELGDEPTAGCSRSDATSGIASTGNTGPTITADTRNANGVGSVTYTCYARDNAGNTNSASSTFSVIYDFNGFFSPINNGVLNTVRAGSAVPVKFSLGGDQGLAIFVSGSPSSQRIGCDATATTDAIEETVNAGGSSLSYDASIDQYNYVWKTEKAWGGTCRRLSVTFNDGETYTADFKFNK